MVFVCVYPICSPNMIFVSAKTEIVNGRHQSIVTYSIQFIVFFFFSFKYTTHTVSFFVLHFILLLWFRINSLIFRFYSNMLWMAWNIKVGKKQYTIPAETTYQIIEKWTRFLKIIVKMLCISNIEFGFYYTEDKTTTDLYFFSQT